MSKKVSLKSQMIGWAATSPVDEVLEQIGTMREVVRQRVPRKPAAW